MTIRAIYHRAMPLETHPVFYCAIICELVFTLLPIALQVKFPYQLLETHFIPILSENFNYAKFTITLCPCRIPRFNQRFYANDAKKLPTSAEIVVAGGGVTGSSVAYHLAKLGKTDVLVLEQGRFVNFFHLKYCEFWI